MSILLEQITVYDLLADDYQVALKKEAGGKYKLTLTPDHHSVEIIEEGGIHPFVMEAFANLCERYLEQYDKINVRKAA